MGLKDSSPPSLSDRSHRRVEGEIAEMLGIAKGVLADGVVTESEASMLRSWIDGHPDVVGRWPGNVLSKRLQHIFEDAIVTPEEGEDLAELLEQLLGGKIGIVRGGITALPLEDPPPMVQIRDRAFVLMGRFAFGSRGMCEEAIREGGGSCQEDLGEDTDFFVIGTFGARDWIRSDWGRHVAEAVGYRRRYGKPYIIGEDHWAASL